MTHPESEFVNCVTLATQYDSSRDTIKRVIRELQGRGYTIECMQWGKQGMLKVHGKQLRKALLQEFRIKAL